MKDSRLLKVLAIKPIFVVLLLLFSFLAAVWAVYTFLPVHADANPPDTWGFSVDWKNNIRDSSLRLISGQTPYFHESSLFPPWAYLLLVPAAVLPPALGAAVIFVLTYLVYSLILFRLGAKLFAILGFLLSHFVLSNAFVGNIDFLAALGFILPPQIGLFFVLIKPQIGIGMVVFWLIEAWRKGRLRQVLRDFLPVTLAYLISFALYGFWPLRLFHMPSDPFNAGLWPFGIPVGAFLLYKAIREHKGLYAMGASPFFAPYVNFSSYAVALLPFIRSEYLLFIAVAFSWL